MNADRGRLGEGLTEHEPTAREQSGNALTSRVTDDTNGQDGELREGEDDWRWSGGEDGEEEASSPPSWSDPSSEEEEEGEGRTPSGYVLLPQDPELMNSDERGCSKEREAIITTTTEEVELKSSPVSSTSPRMTRWLQKQVDDITIESSSSNSTVDTSSTSEVVDGGWAKFSDPAPSSTDSQGWASSTSHQMMSPVTAATTEEVTPISTMREGENTRLSPPSLSSLSLPPSPLSSLSLPPSLSLSLSPLHRRSICHKASHGRVLPPHGSHAVLGSNSARVSVESGTHWWSKKTAEKEEKVAEFLCLVFSLSMLQDYGESFRS